MEREITLKELMAAGVHFGHRRLRWNPKMEPYVYAERDGVHIIDLTKTVEQLSRAVDTLKDIAAAGGTILFVGTKSQAAKTVFEEARRCGMPYVTHRWLGGTLTNFATVKKQITKLDKLEALTQEEKFEKFSKKDKARTIEEIERLEKNVGGLRILKKLPAALFIVDVHNEKNAVMEARALKIPIIGIIDTNANPEIINIPIPANDDATSSIALITGIITDAVAEGRQEMRSAAAAAEGPTEEEINLAEEARKREEEASAIEEKIIGDKEKDEGKKRVAAVGRDKES